MKRSKRLIRWKNCQCSDVFLFHKNRCKNWTFDIISELVVTSSFLFSENTKNKISWKNHKKLKRRKERRKVLKTCGRSINFNFFFIQRNEDTWSFNLVESFSLSSVQDEKNFHNYSSLLLSHCFISSLIAECGGRKKRWRSHVATAVLFKMEIPSQQPSNNVLTTPG